MEKDIFSSINLFKAETAFNSIKKEILEMLQKKKAADENYPIILEAMLLKIISNEHDNIDNDESYSFTKNEISEMLRQRVFTYINGYESTILNIDSGEIAVLAQNIVSLDGNKKIQIKDKLIDNILKHNDENKLVFFCIIAKELILYRKLKEIGYSKMESYYKILTDQIFKSIDENKYTIDIFKYDT